VLSGIGVNFNPVYGPRPTTFAAWSGKEGSREDRGKVRRGERK